jgi:hypothetical protein
LVTILAGEKSVHEYYKEVLEKAREDLLRMDDNKLLANSEEELVQWFMDRQLEPIAKDPTRDVSTSLTKDIREIRGNFRDETRLGAIPKVIIEFPVVPRPTNERVLQLRASTWPTSFSTTIEATFRQNDQMIIITSYPEYVGHIVSIIEERLKYLSLDITNYGPSFANQILDLVRQRKKEVVEYTNHFEHQMQELGITVKTRPNVVQPINVQLKQEVRVLRDKPKQSEGPEEQYLTPDSVKRIVGLIDQAGKGFEVAPAVYAGLGEEDLRTIIIGYLNTVFSSNAVTGETFSKEGKSDIFIRTSGGPILIGECKIWGGRSLYAQTIEQLFRYMAWRHTIGIIITFSRVKGLTKVVSEADLAIKSHPSYQGKFTASTPTYRVSVHEHPDDAEKTIEIHHLLFNLYSGASRNNIESRS